MNEKKNCWLISFLFFCWVWFELDCWLIEEESYGWGRPAARNSNSNKQTQPSLLIEEKNSLLPFVGWFIKEKLMDEWSWNEVGQPSSSPITHCPLIERMKFFHWRAGCSFHFIPLHSTKEKKNKFIFSLLSFRFTCGMNERN